MQAATQKEGPIGGVLHRVGDVKPSRSKIRRRAIGDLVCHLWNGRGPRAGSAVLIVPRPLDQAIWTWWVLAVGVGDVVWCGQLGA